MIKMKISILFNILTIFSFSIFMEGYLVMGYVSQNIWCCVFDKNVSNKLRLIVSSVYLFICIARGNGKVMLP
jgi:hypothetical protein